jgi:hypothetical protein
MDNEDIWRRLPVWRPWAHAGAPGKAASGSDEQRQRLLERMAAQGLPLWSEEPEHCDRCGRELLLGERAELMFSDEDLVLACPLCAPALWDEGYRP